MLNIQNKVVPTLEFLATRLRGPRYYRGEALDEANTSTVLSLEYLWGISMLDLLDTDIRPSIGRFVYLMNHGDVYAIIRACDMAVQVLRQELCSSYDEFKAHLTQEYPPIAALIGCMKGNLDNALSDGNTEAFARAYQFFSFPTRVNLNELEVLRTEAYTAFLETNKRVGEHSYHTFEEAELLRTWFPRSKLPFMYQHFMPKHGSGCVSDTRGKSLKEKYEALRVTPGLHYLSLRSNLREDWFKKGTDQSCCSSDFVPKSYKAYRQVTNETTSRMWIQQGWGQAMVDLYKEVIPHRFDPTDQQRSRDLAWLGSLTGDFATIDLSSASDSISLSLVREWFRETCLYPGLILGRDNTISFPDGTRIQPDIFSGMGNRSTFPLEVGIFTSIVTAAIASTGDEPANSQFQVYGDDIVVETEYASIVMARLEENGFLPNREKSFFSPSPGFREACGGHYFRGEDVSPVYIPRGFRGCPPFRTEMSPGLITGLIDLANDCYSRLPSVRAALIQGMKGHIRPMPAFSNHRFGEIGLFSPNPTNWTARGWYNYDLQIEEFEVGCAVTRQRRINHGTESQLYEWLRQAEIREEKIRGKFYDRTSGRLAAHPSALIDPDSRIVLNFGRSKHPRWESTFLQKEVCGSPV